MQANFTFYTKTMASLTRQIKRLILILLGMYVTLSILRWNLLIVKSFLKCEL